MAGMSTILNIAQGALQANQVAMQVISHNMANVNTPGYTRQKAILEAQLAFSNDQIKLGLGVKVDSVIQQSDQFTTRTIHQKAASLKEYESKATVLAHVESLWNETGDATMSQTLDEFWNAWQEVANNPGDSAARTALLGKAQILAQKFNSLSSDMQQTRSNITTDIQSGIGEVNKLTDQIAQLNDQIVSAEASQTTANDFRDKRNQLLEELSGWVGVDSIEQDNGSVTVLSNGGVLLVNGNKHWDLSTAGDSIYYNGVQSDISDRINGGKIGGLLDLREETIPQYMANLDEMAGTLIQQVNSLHVNGYNLAGNQGMYFFNNFQTAPNLPNSGDYSGAASYISLSSDVLGHPENIAAGSASGAPGDNGNALAIAALQTDGTLSIRNWTITNRGANRSSSTDTETLDSYYQDLAGELGILVQDTNQKQDFAQTVINGLQQVRDSVSGVNLDEELTEMMKVQHAYEAASKIITVTDQLMQTLLSLR
jgi:flagellar hook-associated protein 1 FlgK